MGEDFGSQVEARPNSLGLSKGPQEAENCLLVKTNLLEWNLEQKATALPFHRGFFHTGPKPGQRWRPLSRKVGVHAERQDLLAWERSHQPGIQIQGKGTGQRPECKQRKACCSYVEESPVSFPSSSLNKPRFGAGITPQERHPIPGSGINSKIGLRQLRNPIVFCSDWFRGKHLTQFGQ